MRGVFLVYPKANNRNLEREILLCVELLVIRERKTLFPKC